MARLQVAIFGAGIAGLWLQARLKSLGYDTALFEINKIGGAQTLASQGMIHGGQRYTLQGVLTQHANSIAAMPEIWNLALRGESIPNLGRVTVLAENQHLFSAGGLASSVSAFFASKAMRSKVESLPAELWPAVFKAAANFRGSIYQLDELVIDAKSLVESLAEIGGTSIYQIDRIDLEKSDHGLAAVHVTQANTQIAVQAERFIFTAATGNEEVAATLSPGRAVTQRRPLKQIMVRTIEYPLYAHCITTDPRPRVTISAHPIEGGFVWYLGGLVAVQGVGQSDLESISFAKSELEALFPWINWKEKEWSCLAIDRAEPRSKNGFLPDGPGIEILGNTTLAWPTKLTFAPAVSRLIEQQFSESKFEASGAQSELNLPRPAVGSYPWEDAKWQRI